jgi:hypothetical protein
MARGDDLQPKAREIPAEYWRLRTDSVVAL